MLRNMVKLLIFPIAVLAASLLILLGLSSITTLMTAPQAIDCEAMQGSELVYCTYKSFQIGKVFDTKRFTLTSPFDRANQTALWDEILGKINSQYAWNPLTQRDTGMLAGVMPFFSDLTLVTIPYVWFIAFSIIGLIAGIVLRPLFWKVAKGPTAFASETAATSTSPECQPYSPTANDRLLGGHTSIMDDDDNVAVTQLEDEDENDFIDPDSGSEYEDDGVFDTESLSPSMAATLKWILRVLRTRRTWSQLLSWSAQVTDIEQSAVW